MPTVLGLTNKSNTTSTSSGSGNKTSSNKGIMGGNGRLDTISKRNHAAAVEVETLLWRALCDSPDAAREYLADDCIMINPLFADGSDKPLSKDSDPSLEKLLKGSEPWTSFRMHGQPAVVEVDLMAIAILYKITLYRQGGKKGGIEEVDATVSSTWRQTAGADWLLCAQHVAYAD